MKCVGAIILPLKGNQADQYMREHLRLVKIDIDAWVGHNECPDTGVRWVETHPYPAAHGGGPPCFDEWTPRRARVLNNADAPGEVTTRKNVDVEGP
jgi:hypothetical protein